MDHIKQEPAVQLSGIGKKYQLGEISGRTFREDIMNRFFGRSIDPPKTIYALKDIDLTIYKGQTVGIIGRNGAGKSTLLKLLSRITMPSEGTIDIYGRVTSMLEVGTGFHGDLTGRENIYVNGAIMGMSRSEIDAKMKDIIEFSEIGEFIDTPVKRYSSGMYVKLGFAVAAHLDSEIVVMDEVLAVGDIKFQQKCLEKMKNIARQEGRTVLYVSHNMNTIRTLCDRCIVLSQGKLVFDGSVNKAVAKYMYMGEDRSMRTVYEYNAESRPYIRTAQQADDFHMTRLEVLNVSEPIYAESDHPELLLQCDLENSRNAVGFRLELWYQDGSKIGSMMTCSGADLHAGENHIRLRLDLSHLTEGQYRADLIAYQSVNGQEYVLDRVYPGLCFAVSSMNAPRIFNSWNNQYWGNVRLHDMNMEVI